MRDKIWKLHYTYSVFNSIAVLLTQQLIPYIEYRVIDIDHIGNG